MFSGHGCYASLAKEKYSIVPPTGKGQHMAYRRAKRTSSYTFVSNDLLQNSSLSFEARGLVALMLSDPEKQWHISDLLTEKNRKDSLRRILREAEKAGYIQLINSRENGLFNPYYIAFQFPIPDSQRNRTVYRVIGRCHYCGQPATTYDHLFPQARGGPDTEDNKVPSCLKCNSKKGNRTPTEAGMAAERSL